jgi:uncharacterized flavoprotein (TIGR03862 family)
MTQQPVIIIGAGPAGLMAAEIIAGCGHAVTVYERKPSIGRKFLMAGRGGLNLTHSEGMDTFIPRYREAAPWLAPMIDAFTPADLRAWCDGLGQDSFTGSSGRVFPRAMKTSPLLRAWQTRLNAMGVRMETNTDWMGWDDNGRILLSSGAVDAPAVLLALGGGSWPKLGSDASWVPLLQARGVGMRPVVAANCGFFCAWSDIFSQKFSGQPLKSIAITHAHETVAGEAMIDARGIEGGAVYALSAPIRDAIASEGSATIHIDLKPAQTIEQLLEKLSMPRAALSFTNFIRRATGLPPIAISLLREGSTDPASLSPRELAALIKAVPRHLTAPFPIDRAISSAGGITRDSVDSGLMLKNIPGVFVAGEMLDWEAPTGGYLLQATLSTAVHAAKSLVKHLENVR